MGKRPFFSVIVPVYNTEKYLEKCIESIRRQSYKEFREDGQKLRAEVVGRAGLICEVSSLILEISKFGKRHPDLQLTEHLPPNHLTICSPKYFWILPEWETNKSICLKSHLNF